MKFCNKRSELDGLQPCYNLETWESTWANGYRLPTEAEWDTRAGQGTTTAYFFGDAPQNWATTPGLTRIQADITRPVGQKQPNPWGLYDICGNVWEWCNDFYKVDYYRGASRRSPRTEED